MQPIRFVSKTWNQIQNYLEAKAPGEPGHSPARVTDVEIGGTKPLIPNLPVEEFAFSNQASPEIFLAIETSDLKSTKSSTTRLTSVDETEKPKHPISSAGLILLATFSLAVSGFCVLGGLLLTPQSMVMGISTILFGLFSLGFAGLAVTNLNAGNATISRNKMLSKIYRNQKLVGILFVLGSLFSCLGTYAGNPAASPDASAIHATRISTSTVGDISSLQTAALETALMRIYQSATANAPTITFTLAAPTNTPSSTSTAIATRTPTATTEPFQGTIIQDVSNMRLAPSLNAPVLTTLAINTKVFAIGMSTDKIWLLVITENGTQGWIHNGLAQFSGSLANLPVLTEVLPTPLP